MNKAFIFDFDGVIINSEPLWEIEKTKLYQNFFGKEIFLRLGPTVGMNMDAIYDRAVQCGAKTDKESLINEFFNLAQKIYEIAPITPDIDTIGKTLTGLGYKIAIVSASPMEWIKISLNRTILKNYVTYILSLYDRKDLPHKPAPDGYLEAIKILGASPQTTVILEDSNIGIESARASGAFTIGFRQNLVKGQTLRNADEYADNLEDVLNLIKK